MNRKILFAAAILAAATATAAAAQVRLPVIFPLGRDGAQPAPPSGIPGAPMSTGAMQADLVVKAGSDTVYFPPDGSGLNPNSIATLTAQARWLIANPFAYVRLEGHGGPLDSRDYALAIGDKRASAVRDFLVMQGVAPQRISVVSWGKERPGSVRVGPTVVAAGARVVTVVVQ